jgi:hypothetical protein
MVGAVAVFGDCQRPPNERLRLAQPVGGPQQSGEIAEIDRNLGMVDSSNFCAIKLTPGRHQIKALKGQWRDCATSLQQIRCTFWTFPVRLRSRTGRITRSVDHGSIPWFALGPAGHCECLVGPLQFIHVRTRMPNVNRKMSTAPALVQTPTRST